MRQLIGNLIFDSDKSKELGRISKELGCHEEALFQTAGGRFFLLITELDVHPHLSTIRPITTGAAKIWMNKHQDYFHQPEKTYMPPLTKFPTFIQPQTTAPTKDLELLFRAINESNL